MKCSISKRIYHDHVEQRSVGHGESANESLIPIADVVRSRETRRTSTWPSMTEFTVLVRRCLCSDHHRHPRPEVRVSGHFYDDYKIPQSIVKAMIVDDRKPSLSVTYRSENRRFNVLQWNRNLADIHHWRKRARLNALNNLELLTVG